MITIITIDDEPLALKQIKNYIEKTPFLELKDAFESPILAFTYLQ
jgi:two-component system LytT family response regulator